MAVHIEKLRRWSWPLVQRKQSTIPFHLSFQNTPSIDNRLTKCATPVVAGSMERSCRCLASSQTLSLPVCASPHPTRLLENLPFILPSTHPAYFRAASPVKTKTPAPRIPPTPNITKSNALRTFFKPFSSNSFPNCVFIDLTVKALLLKVDHSPMSPPRRLRVANEWQREPWVDVTCVRAGTLPLRSASNGRGCSRRS